MLKTNIFDLFSHDEPRIGVIVGTGPSLTKVQLDQVKHLKKFGCNNAIFDCDLDVHLACNIEWWDHYCKATEKHRCDKWTWDKATAEKYGLNYIEGRWGDGLSTDPNYIHYHHGSGPQILNLAYHYGVKTFLLIGWDMCYREKRHYFGEYPEQLRHFPKTGPNGELTGLIKEMETIKPIEYNINVINCTPDSAMTCFPLRSLSECLNEYK